jgi:hypothetical protein
MLAGVKGGVLRRLGLGIGGDGGGFDHHDVGGISRGIKRSR